MKFHFKLEYRRICRAIASAGFNPERVLIALGLIISIFIGYATLVGDKSSMVMLLLSIVSFSLIFRKRRTAFYSQIYSKSQWIKIQGVESLIIFSPCFIVLVLSRNFALAFYLISLAFSLPLILSYLRSINSNFTLPPLPTPFKKHPFEFIRGFRTAWPIYFLSIYVIYKAHEVSNSNLGVFAVLIIVLTPSMFYSKPEPLSYVTIYAANCKEFLRSKVKSGLIKTVLLSLPISLLTLFLFPDGALLIMGSLLLGMLFTTNAILSKYAYFPNEINVIQSISLILCLMMPFLILVSIPVFYRKAASNLKPILT